MDNNRHELIDGIISKYRPGLPYIVDVVCADDEFYGEWDAEDGLIFTVECDDLTDAEFRYVVLHEIAHALTSGGHHDNFYGVLTALVVAEQVDWDIAVRIEQIIPRLWESHALHPSMA